MVWCADPGKRTVSRGLDGDNYTEVDLGAVCEIEYLRTKGAWGIPCHWEAYATLDATKPIRKWHKLGGKYAMFPTEKGGKPYTIAFTPVKARYVRVYGLRSWGRDDVPMEHPEVFGTVLKDEKSPAPEHLVVGQPTYAHDADWHWFACGEKGCTARVSQSRHTWDFGKVTKLSENGRAGEITKCCRVCKAERVCRGEDALGANLALGRPARFSNGKPAPWVTDGNRDYTAGWSGYIGDAKPMVEINDDAPCYFEIDLGAMYELSAVNFVDDLQNTRRMFAAFVSADESAPIADWTHTAVLYLSLIHI